MRREEHFAVGELSRVDIDISTGSVQVHTGAAGRIDVIVDASSADQFEIAQLGDTVSVRAPSGWLSRGGKATSRSSSRHAPMRRSTSSTAEVTTRGELGAMRIRTASSDVAVDEAGRVEAQSASGDVRIRRAARRSVERVGRHPGRHDHRRPDRLVGFG